MLANDRRRGKEFEGSVVDSPIGAFTLVRVIGEAIIDQNVLSINKN